MGLAIGPHRQILTVDPDLTVSDALSTHSDSVSSLFADHHDIHLAAPRGRPLRGLEARRSLQDSRLRGARARGKKACERVRAGIRSSQAPGACPDLPTPNPHRPGFVVSSNSCARSRPGERVAVTGSLPPIRRSAFLPGNGRDSRHTRVRVIYESTVICGAGPPRSHPSHSIRLRLRGAFRRQHCRSNDLRWAWLRFDRAYTQLPNHSELGAWIPNGEEEVPINWRNRRLKVTCNARPPSPWPAIVIL